MTMRRLFLSAIVMLALIASALAQGSVVVVDDVEVETTGDTAELAKQQAVTQVAPRRAIIEALKALANDPSTINDLPLTDREVQQTVIDYEVIQENTAQGRYIARLRFRLRVDMIDRLFQTKGLRYAQRAQVPVLVIPVLLVPRVLPGSDGELAPVDEAMEMAVEARTPGTAGQPQDAEPAPTQAQPTEQAVLWESGGPWLASWARQGPVDGLLPLLVPLGDIDDNNDLTAQMALQRDLDGFETIAGRYGAGGVLLVIARARGGGDGLRTPPERLEVTVERYGLDGKQRELAFVVDGVADEPIAAFYDRARDTVVDAVLQDWRRGGDQQVGSLNALSVFVPVLTLADWQEAQRRLRGIARIREVRTDSINSRQVKLVLVHAGRIDSLRDALRERKMGLALEPTRVDGGDYERSSGFDTQASYQLSLLP